jgi:serralysin
MACTGSESRPDRWISPADQRDRDAQIVLLPASESLRSQSEEEKMATTAIANSIAATGNDYLDSLIIGDQWNNNFAITYYFDDGVGPEEAWLDEAKAAFVSVFGVYENYIDIEFVEVDNAADANLVMVMDTTDEINATARFEFPDASDDQAVGQFPYNWSRWTEWHLQQGGYAYETVMHEVGHALGLVHPHGSQGLNEEPFPGVTAANETGDNGLNSAIYTVMSYNDWGQFWAPDNPVSSDYGWGYIGTPMAFDIAALQHIYGANLTYRSGNSTYTLPAVEDDGTFWTAIWDTGGVDLIRHTGSEAATIDLRAAPLTGTNAGGYVSRVDGIAGGFTIANGVVIENAQGGSGNDTINGNDVANDIDGNGGHDTITAFGGADVVNGGSGNDHINGGSGNDEIDGGSGNDDLDGGTGNDDIDGGIGNDHLEGGSNDDILAGGSGNDHLEGETGNDNLSGGPGDDTLNGGAGADTADYFTASGWVHVDLAIAGPQATGAAEDTDTLIGIEYLVGSNGFADQLRGNDASNRLYGVGGNDILEGRGGNDILDGGMGLDTASYESAPSGVAVDLNNGLPQNTLGAGVDSLISIDNLTGSAYADILLGDLQDNALQGLGGNDWLLGGAGNDSIIGGAGDDFLIGGEGDDNLVGSSGTDVVSYLTAAAGVTVSLAIGGYQNTIGAGSDRLIGVEHLHGSTFDDTLTSSAAGNTMLGGAGNDALIGAGGNDALSGGAADDTLDGGAGDDILVAGAGRDIMTGGDDDDIFDFNSASEMGTTAATRKIITDFSHHDDTIDLSTIDANGAGAGDTAFSFLKGNGTDFTGEEGQLRWMKDNNAGVANDRTYIEGDINGDAVADFTIELIGLHNVKESDFIL